MASYLGLLLYGNNAVMVLISYGNSEIGAYGKSEIGHLFIVRVLANWKSIREKTCFFLHKCPTRCELPSNISTMSTISLCDINAETGLM